MKKPISATLEEDLIKWISDETKRSNIYRNKSHLIEAALELLKQKIESENAANTKTNSKAGGQGQQQNPSASSRGRKQ